MSGGVDSSLAAALLKEQGYDVVGVMMRLWAELAAGEGSSNKCCSLESVHDARRVADLLDIPFYLINVERPFKERVVDFTVAGYLAGQTPNPCIQCNRHIRFDYLFNYALTLGADYLATGHYARVRQAEDSRLPETGNHSPDQPIALPAGQRALVTGHRLLLTGLDPQKDQSYVLHMLTQEKLARVLFPVGEYTKVQVREMAAARGLPVASRHDSQDLCFLADGDYRRFLRDWSPEGAIRPGAIVDAAGRTLGQHQGLPFYTVGQRKGIGVAAREPLYVLGLDVERNAVVVGPAEALSRSELTAGGVNWIAGFAPPRPMAVQAKIRYRAAPAPALVTALPRARALVQFDQPLRGITPGQAVVFYDGEVCLGGGIIEGLSKQSAGQTD